MKNFMRISIPRITADGGNLNFLLCSVLILALPFSWVSTALGSVYRLITILAAGIWLINNRGRIILHKSKKALIVAWLCYAGLACLSVLWAVERETALQTVMGMALLVIISLIFASSQLTEKNRQTLDSLWTLDTAILVLLFLFGQRDRLGSSGRETLVILGTDTDANEFSSYFIVGIAACVHQLMIQRKKTTKILIGLVIAGAVYSLFLCASRGAILSVLICVGCLVFYKKPIKRVVSTLAICAAACVVIGFVLIPLIPEDNLERLTLSAIVSDGGSGRLDIWRNSLKLFFQGNPMRWLFGYGEGGIHIRLSFLYTATMHNQLLQQLVNYGFLGLAFYCAMLIQAWKFYRREFPAYMGVFLGVMAMSLTLTMGPSYKLIWIILFLPLMATQQEGGNALCVLR